MKLTSNDDVARGNAAPRDIALDETAAGGTPPRETLPSIAVRAGEHAPTFAVTPSPASTTLSGSRRWTTPARAVFVVVAAFGVINLLYFVVRFMIAADPPSLHESFRGTSTAIVHRDLKPANIFLEGTAADPIATRPAK